jgi:ABC-type transport system involved in multi-copper enzyme maturation permease subunit
LIGFLLLYLTLALCNAQFLLPESLNRAGFMVIISTLFLAGFFGIGLMVSSFFHSSRTSIVVLLVTWVVLQLVIPKAGEMIAVVAEPMRSEYDVRVERQEIIAEELEHLEKNAGRLFTEVSGSTSPEYAFRAIRSDEPWVNEDVKAFQRLVRETKLSQMDRLRGVTQAWQLQRDRQRTLGNAISLVSPASALAFLTSDAAGTGDLAYEHYRDAVGEQYQVVDREYFSKIESNNYRIRIGGAMLSGNFDDEAPSPESVPPFTVSPPSIQEVIAENGWALCTLTFYLVVPFLVGYVRFLNYDPR